MGVAVLAGLICGFICIAINNSKNRNNPVLAFFAGFFFGLIGIIVNAILPSEK